MRLQSHDEFEVVATFGLPDGELVVMRREDARELLDEPLRGHFSRRLGHLGVLYRADGGLRLRVGSSDSGLDDAHVTWSRTGSIARFSFTTPQGRETIEYLGAPAHDFDFSAGAEEEHFDFGLFVANIAADAGRAARLYQGAAKP